MILKIKCNLKQIRTRANLSQNDLADLTDVKIGKISEYENEHATPSVYTLWKIAVALECRPDEIYEIIEVDRDQIDIM